MPKPRSRAVHDLLSQSGYYADLDKKAAAKRKEAELRWKRAGQTLKRIKK